MKRKYLSKKEMVGLDLLDIEKIKSDLSAVVICCENIKVKVLDYRGNPLSPENFCYVITYEQFNKKGKVFYYPNTVGFQW